MKNLIPFCICASVLLFVYTDGRAQNEVTLNLKQPAKQIIIDGNIAEWGDSLSYYNPEERLNYAIVNTNDTLYLALKVYDRSEIIRILHGGLTFSIDPKGKKKETFSVTYPLNVQQGNNGPLNIQGDEEKGNVSPQERQELMQEQLTTLRGMKVTGFKDVEDPAITTSNTYGFRGAINYDADGNLIYEEAIPLSLFHVSDIKNAWAFNLKINAVERPQPGSSDNAGGGFGGGRHGGGFGGGGHRGGGGFGGGGHRGGGSHQGMMNNANRGQIFSSVDFWGKFMLAK